MNSTQPEVWRPLPGWLGLYEVSDRGRVRSLPRQRSNGVRGGKILTRTLDQFGYPTVMLSDCGRTQRSWVHRLVLEAFVGPCPQGMECCHNDGNPTNNVPANLRWDTHAANLLDRREHGTVGALTECKNGHPYTSDNTRLWKRGGTTVKVCRACAADSTRRYLARKRDAAGSGE